MKIPEKWKSYWPGWKEAFTAVAYTAVVCGAIYVISVALTGCVGTTVGVKYTHDSSIPDYHDHNESNMAGPYVRVYACRNGRDRLYCPEVEVSAEWEFHTPYPHTYGTNPVGQIELRQPIWIKR